YDVAILQGGFSELNSLNNKIVSVDDDRFADIDETFLYPLILSCAYMKGEQHEITTSRKKTTSSPIKGRKRSTSVPDIKRGRSSSRTPCTINSNSQRSHSCESKSYISAE